MWQVVSEKSDYVILTQDDDYSESTTTIIKDVLPGIERAEWEDFWIIADREEAIRTALVTAKKWDIILIAWKWDEHVLITQNWPIKWHDKTKVQEILKDLDDNKIIESK
jgi:UDP-N-acetylmuramoyl-L-alanyl-D-glutamate--2,6-diaminopimelate ligase